MTGSRHRCVPRLPALLALAAWCALAAPDAARGQSEESSAAAENETWFDAEPLSIHSQGIDAPDGPSNSEFLDPQAAKFDKWQPLVEEPAVPTDADPELRPFDW